MHFTLLNWGNKLSSWSDVISDDGWDVGSDVTSDVGSDDGSDDGSDVGSDVGSDIRLDFIWISMTGMHLKNAWKGGNPALEAPVVEVQEGARSTICHALRRGEGWNLEDPAHFLKSHRLAIVSLKVGVQTSLFLSFFMSDFHFSWLWFWHLDWYLCQLRLVCRLKRKRWLRKLVE